MLSAIGCSGKIEGSFPVVLPGFSEAELAYSDGFDSAEQGLYAEAISHYDKAIQLDPDYADAYNNRGIAYRELGHHTLANADEATACALDKQFC